MISKDVMSVIAIVNNSLLNIMVYAFLVPLGSFILVFLVDLIAKTSLLKKSFFLIIFIQSCWRFFQYAILILQEFDTFRIFKYLPNIQLGIILFDLCMIVMVTVNRIFAITVPSLYAKDWKRVNTLIICLILFVATIIYCFVISRGIYYERDIIYYKQDIIYLICIVICSLLSFLCLLKPKPAANEDKEYAEWKLLLFTFFINIFYLFENSFTIYDFLTNNQLFRIKYDYDVLEIIALVVTIMGYCIIFGTVILLLICR